MKATRDRKSTITLIDRADSQLPNTVFKQSPILAMRFTTNLQELSLHACKYLHHGSSPLFHNCYDGTVDKEMLPTQFIFHQSEQTEEWRHQNRMICCVCQDCKVKIRSLHHSFLIGMEPSITVLKEKDSCLLWPHSGNSSLRHCQSWDWVVGVGGLPRS